MNQKSPIFLTNPDHKIYHKIQITSILDQQPKQKEKKKKKKKQNLSKNRTQSHVLKQLLPSVHYDHYRSKQNNKETRITYQRNPGFIKTHLHPSTTAHNFTFFLNQKQQKMDQIVETEKWVSDQRLLCYLR